MLFSFGKYLNFYSDVFSHLQNGLGKKAKVSLKICDVINWEKIITIHIFPNIWRSKGNQTMKFGQLIEYNMRHIFLKKSYTIYGGENGPKPFSKKWYWAYLWISSLKFYKLCFYCMRKSKNLEILWNLSADHFSHIIFN